MKHNEIRIDVLANVVADAQRVFTTKDISEDSRMLAAHPELALHSHYHSFVGRALSEHCARLNIAEIRKATSRGSRWEKRGASSELNVSEPCFDAPGTKANETAAPSSFPIGPQYKKDNLFAARMRLHQSWYRSQVLHADYGTGPFPTSTSKFGNMLTREDGAAGRNFLTPDIATVARERVARGGGAVESFRLFHNMQSSQPMCFNLFGPLVKDRELARHLVAKLIPEEIAEVNTVEFEYAPEPAADYLGDRTAFDAFVEYTTTGGRLCALGIETKLTEPFSQNEYDGEKYRRWMRVQGAPWLSDADGDVQYIQHNQLWRDHLLAVAMRYHPRSRYENVRLMIIYHQAEKDFPSIITGYRKLLKDGDDTLIVMPLDRLHRIWTSAVEENSSYSKWLRDFKLRYLDLQMSETCCAPKSGEDASDALSNLAKF